ncbi:SDR family NAD(P)-dependent oxidoreductase [Cryobacterium sp. Y62]|uniref:SDR family NAD(P)-dependent oxidoreductase n=1 Tax=Cryobacterium sp. Y62 TaxID=2048284 RepID=UPI000CE381E5|nr:SDR family oxidoreductase [Cryobacterium sp. Y62]
MPVQDLFDLRGQVALVTGASEGGLGYHSAAALAELGAVVHISDHAGNSELLRKTAEDLRSQGFTVHAHQADVTEEAEVVDLVEQISSEGGRLDVLAHHAGVNLRKTTWETSLAEWNKVIDINVTGTWLVAKHASAVMAKSRSGRIITLGSIYNSIVGPIPEAAYYASKGAIGNLTRGLAMEFAQHGITVNCIAPGTFYPTRMTEALSADPERLASMAERTMLGRLGDPRQDLRGAIAFFATAASAYVTGQTLYVDGGWTAW